MTARPIDHLEVIAVQPHEQEKQRESERAWLAAKGDFLERLTIEQRLALLKRLAAARHASIQSDIRLVRHLLAHDRQEAALRRVRNIEARFGQRPHSSENVRAADKVPASARPEPRHKNARDHYEPTPAL